MSLMPVSKIGKIEFCEQHAGPWTTNSVAIGSSAAAITAWEAKVDAARAAYEAQKAAQNAAKAATNDLRLAMAAMEDATSDIVKQIRTQAAIVGDSVYSLAEIPAPATPGLVGAPGTATDFGVELFQDGSLGMKWKCVNPAGCTGVVYQVWRRVGGSGDFTYVGGVGSKKFVDTTIPAGASFLTYKVQGVRSTSVGPWATFNVFFGAASNGAMTATVDATPKLAA